ncbi:hypothetical protein SAV14893_039960 [Streptomyces avermitilis]|uniref:Histidine kinase/HSP90-like ATPase domain-containing protein n=1 Tax=Streptomyces avermitilis TaxID=33903 RepID=A0A4D4M0J9_STRAX|nr:hypothetical protein SAVMC3_51960 [Streptomyces avermitilis]GDY64603.1 hypothetical protein SAV14893_039960 [Streptomyces avermitilis]GDY75214.1 hypothetical protein SAV31267_046990 [Streptomyces avermitilis]GDY84229.1 hypothetical protein SAVCW2_34280 [Streptomyces avermitilis]
MLQLGFRIEERGAGGRITQSRVQLGHRTSQVHHRGTGASETVRIGAWDANPEPPYFPGELKDLTDAEDGRGLALVSACSSLRGRQRLSRFGNRGKYVWCELATT